MAANWGGFVSAVGNYNKNNTSINQSQYVNFIATQYELAVMSAVNQFSQMMMPLGNAEKFKPPLMSAMQQCSRMIDSKSAKVVLANGFNQAVIAFWTGAFLSLVPPPPGVAIAFNNLVLFPGVMAFKGVEATMDPYEFPRKLADAFRQHLNTVSGQLTGITPSTPPAPIVVPWQGLA